jgi:hypothetical protein
LQPQCAGNELVAGQVGRKKVISVLEMEKEVDLSNDLVDGQIDDKATANELMMLIDTYSRKDIVFAVVLFVALIASTGLAGAFGPDLIHEEQNTLPINSLSLKNVLSFTIPPLSPVHQFLIIRITFSIPPTEPRRSIFLSFTSTMLFYNHESIVRREQQSFAHSLVFGEGENISAPIVFLFDRFISYDRADIRLDIIESGSVDSVFFSWTYADEKHLSFQLWIRVTFLLASSITLVVFYISIRSLPIWSFEQQWTVLLSVGSLLGLNPLFPAFFVKPTLVSDLVDRLLQTASRVLLLFFILVIIDYVGTQRMRVCFFPPKICFFSIVFLVELVYPLLFNGWEVLGVEVVAHSVVVALRFTRIALEIALLCWTIVASVRSFRTMQTTDTFKFSIYLVAFAIILPIALFPRVLENCGSFGKASGPFAMRIASENAIALLMVFVHWPYRYKADELYRHPNAASSDGELFASDEGS